ncbi:hypothetical protein FQN54_008268 [Arachnomyces sp. PD_36]|nr:hypothetical protein FQN54_008268 [Arachnomyces sp. PD_36]
MADNEGFGGFKWAGMSTFPETYWRHGHAQSFLKSVDWQALCASASGLHDGKECTLEPDIAMGLRHMVRILKFEDDSRWVARLRIPLNKEDSDEAVMRSEVDCLRLVKERTTVPVPAVFAFIPRQDSNIGANVMLMECLMGNVGVDLNFDFIPTEYKSSFYEEMARIQTEISSITFPKIGSIIRLEDGSYDVGPIPGIGGPFETATEYFKALAPTLEFPTSESTIAATCGDLATRVSTSVAEFPRKISEMASQFCLQDNGPFVLCRPQFGHTDIVVNDSYKILGVIDWEDTISAPWETVEFPFPLNLVPAAMDPPWNFDENGVPVDEESRQRLRDRADYVAAVLRAESSGHSSMLSNVLKEERVQDLASAISLYQGGKMGLYSDIFDLHYPKGVEGRMVGS